MEKKMLDKCNYENFATENSVITITTLMGKVFKNCVYEEVKIYNNGTEIIASEKD